MWLREMRAKAVRSRAQIRPKRQRLQLPNPPPSHCCAPEFDVCTLQCGEKLHDPPHNKRKFNFIQAILFLEVMTKSVG